MHIKFLIERKIKGVQFNVFPFARADFIYIITNFSIIPCLCRFYYQKWIF